MITTGFVAGAFDIIHPGYILLLQDCKRVCDYLIVGLHVDPSIERPGKNKPVHNAIERGLILESLVFVNGVVQYRTEAQLYHLLKELKPDIRIIGSDYKDKPELITGYDLPIKIHWHEREHEYSATRLRQQIIQLQS